MTAGRLWATCSVTHVCVFVLPTLVGHSNDAVVGVQPIFGSSTLLHIRRDCVVALSCVETCHFDFILFITWMFYELFAWLASGR